jgi:hypothetical protein
VSSDAEIKKYILPSNLCKTPVIYVLEMEMTGNAVTPSHAQIDQSEMFNLNLCNSAQGKLLFLVLEKY